MNRPPALLFGVPIADLTMAETIDLVSELVTIGRRERRTFQIATVNVDFVVNAMTDADVHRILGRADVCLADGLPLVWTSALFGMPIRERVAGADLVPLLVARSESTGWRIHVLGSSPQVAASARDLLGRRFPDARISIDPDAIIADPCDVDAGVLDSITDLDPDILCVALGNPKQERFIDAYRAHLGVPVMIGIGGTLDLLVGAKRRAPRWVQRIGIEWVVRAIQEPRRLGRRYGRDITIFGPRLVREWWSVRGRRRGSGLTITGDVEGLRVRTGTDPLLTGSLGWVEAAALIEDGAALTIESASLMPMNDRAVSVLFGLARAAQLRGRSVRLAIDPRELDVSIIGVGVSATMLSGTDGDELAETQ